MPSVVFGDNFHTPKRPEELRGIDGDGRAPFGFTNLYRWHRVEGVGQRPFRFGVNTPGIESRAAWQDRARRLEADGWSTLVVPDHLGGVSAFAPPVSAADATSALRVGSLVVNNHLFHPLRLAQEVATVDLLTDGRVDLGLGSGWSKPEYELHRTGCGAGVPTSRSCITSPACW
jgi:Luciferase-like monooxygenase